MKTEDNLIRVESEFDSEILEEVGAIEEEQLTEPETVAVPVVEMKEEAPPPPKEDTKPNYGRPLKFKTVKELEGAIEKYFAKDMPTRRKVEGLTTVQVPCPTIAGLALYLGFVDRHSMYDYEKRPEFSHAIKSARAAIERHYEELLQGGLGAGAIFALKNFGWKDRTEVDNDPDDKLARAVERVRELVPD